MENGNEIEWKTLKGKRKGV